MRKIHNLSIHPDTFWEFVSKAELCAAYKGTPFWCRKGDDALLRKDALSHEPIDIASWMLYPGGRPDHARLLYSYYSDQLRRFVTSPFDINVHTIVTQGGVHLKGFDEIVEFLLDLSIVYCEFDDTSDPSDGIVEMIMRPGPMAHLYPKPPERT